MVKKTEIDKEMLAQIQRLNTEQELVEHLGYTFEQLRKLPVSDLQLKADVQKEMNRLNEAIKKERRRHFKEMYGHDIKIVSIVCVIVIIGAFVAFYVYPNYIQEHPIEAIEIENLNTEMEVGEGYSFTYNIIPSNATNKEVEWEIRGLSGNVLEGATITSDKSLIRISLDPAMFFDGDKINLVAINHASKVYQSATITVKSDFEFTPFKGVSKDISAGSTAEIDPELPSSTSYKAEWSVKVSSEYLSYSVSGNSLKLQASSLAAKNDHFDISVKYGKYGPVNETITVSDGFVFDPFRDVPTFNLKAGDHLNIIPPLPSDKQYSMQWESESSEVILNKSGDNLEIVVKTLASNKGFDIKATYGPYTQTKSFKVSPVTFDMKFDTAEFVGFESFNVNLTNSELLSSCNTYWTANNGVSLALFTPISAAFTIAESISDGSKSTITASISYQGLDKTITREITLTSAEKGIHYIDSVEDLEKLKTRKSYNYSLVKDIVLTKPWYPTDFSGTLNGNNHKITLKSESGYCPEASSDDLRYYGFITILYGNVSNLNVHWDQMDINVGGGKACLGGIAAKVEGTKDGKGVIDSCTCSGSITGWAERVMAYQGYMYIGGIAGQCSNNYKIVSCSNTSAIRGDGYFGYVGGIIGQVVNGNGSISYCQSSGKTDIESYNGAVIFNPSGKAYSGGILGHYQSGQLSINYCLSKSTYINSHANDVYSAGIVGYINSSDCTIQHIGYLSGSIYQYEDKVDNKYYNGSAPKVSEDCKAYDKESDMPPWVGLTALPAPSPLV